MAEEEEEEFGRIAPDHLTLVFLDIEYVPQRAFCEHPNIREVICSENVKEILGAAFADCYSLRRVIMPGVKLIGNSFIGCQALTDVECDKAEIIKEWAFSSCISLRSINLPSARIIEEGTLSMCDVLTVVKFGNKLERIDRIAFGKCPSLERITIPLKDGIITSDDIFQGCENLNQVHLEEGEVHETIASFESEEWRDDMNREIDSINQILPNACAGYHNASGRDAGEKAQVIRTWIRSVIDKMNHYKAEHQRLLNEAATLLELAIWKANLDDNNGGRTICVREGVRTTRGSVKRSRRELCVTSGASMVVKNVLPFLELKS